MKLLVESPSDSPLLDPTSGDHISGVRPSVVWSTAFIQKLITDERIILLEELDDEADDTEFLIAYRVDKAKALAGLPRPEAVKPKTAAKK